MSGALNASVDIGRGASRVGGTLRLLPLLQWMMARVPHSMRGLLSPTEISQTPEITKESVAAAPPDPFVESAKKLSDIFT